MFDLVDKGVDAADRVLNRGKQVADDHRARRSKREVIDTEATPTPKKDGAAKATTAIAKKPHFYIVEAVGEAGTTHFVVTDGGNARAECTSRELAEKILRALEKAQ